MIASIAATANAQERVETGRNAEGHRSVHTEIVIDATPEQVWTVLTDTKSYPQWAVFMEAIEGKIRDQGQITAHFRPNEKKEKVNKVTHTISVTEGKEFSWSETVMMGIKDHHRYIVEPMPNGQTRFIQSDLVKSGMSWLMGNSLIKFEKENYPKFNRSLKAEVERRFPKQ